MGAVLLPYKSFNDDIPCLFKEDPRNAGYDLFARIDAPIKVKPGDVVKIPLNVATEIPPIGVGLLFQRSSTFKKWKVMLTNGVGVIDSLYCGDGDEWCAEFINITDDQKTINPGDKMCQAVFLPLLDVIPDKRSVLGNEDRGGFGTSFDNVTEMGA